MASEAAEVVRTEKDVGALGFDRLADILSTRIEKMRRKIYAPDARKHLRKFSSGEASRLLGISDSHLRQLTIDGIGPQPEVGAGGKRLYSLADLNGLRLHFAGTRPKSALQIYPRRRPGEKLQVVACASFKGGSGKTTTSATLAQYLALRGYRVLAVDLDPQASLTAIFGIQPETDLEDGDSLYGAIRYGEGQRDVRAVIRKTYFEGIDLVPGAIELQEWEHEVPAAMQQRGASPFFRRIAEVLGEVEQDYDVVVLDCPPQLGFLTLSALTAATCVLIPVFPHMLDVMSLSAFLMMASDLLSVVEKRGGAFDRDWIGFLITRHNPNDASEVEIVSLLRSLFGQQVLTRTAVQSAAVSSAGLYRKTIFEIDRGEVGRGTYDRALEAMNGVCEEIEALLTRSWGRT